jgi:hypothetical protein
MYLMHITNKTLIKGVQKEFNTVYPFLWIEFFDLPLKGKGRWTRLEKVDVERPVNQFIDIHDPVVIDIREKRTVLEVKKDFQQKLGLGVQVLRRSGNVWVGTSLTEDWTLSHQNLEGEQIKF